MKERPSISLIMVGVGGMGYHLLQALRARRASAGIVIAAAVDPRAETTPSFPWLKERAIPVFPDLGKAFSAGIEADLVFISSPIQFHVPQSIQALEKRTCVLCEKPLAAAVQDADSLVEAEERSPFWVEIGYQWSYSRAVAALKQDILEGRYGLPRRLRSLCFWPRSSSYYRRNDWAGRLRDSQGAWVLDSPANNAMAHFLHNMLFCLGGTMEHSAVPAAVEAEAFRAYPIETFDTIACRIHTLDGVELLFYASHTTEESKGPIFQFDFSEGRIILNEGGSIIGEGREGPRDYGCPDADPFLKVDFVLNRFRTGSAARCGPAASRAQTLCINGIHDSLTRVGSILPEALVRKGDFQIVPGMDKTLMEAYRRGLLPSETGFREMPKGRLVNLVSYRHFPEKEYNGGEMIP